MKKNMHPLPLDVAAHSYHWPYTKSQHLKGRESTGCTLESAFQKGHKNDMGKQVQRESMKIGRKSCATPATPATPEMFYSTNKIPKLKLPKHKLVRHFFPKTSTGHWDVLPHLLEFVPLMSSTLPRWLPTHHYTKQRATNFISNYQYDFCLIWSEKVKTLPRF